MARLSLPSVTLCAASSVNVSATVAALRSSLDQVDFADCILFTDANVASSEAIHVVEIEKFGSAADYSDFLLRKLVGHIRTEYCLVVQWDGFVLNAKQWDPRFLECDYLGAVWPQFHDGNDVGNGGFSLRSRKLLEACLDPRFQGGHPEDVTICRVNRSYLEREHGIRFGDRALASRFSFERDRPSRPTFGFHGVFNMAEVLGADAFWDIYCASDDRRTAFVDYGLLMGQLGGASNSLSKRFRLTMDLAKSWLT